MASVTNGNSPISTPTGNNPSTTTTQKDGGSRLHNKISNAKMTERTRKESPVDQARRAPPQKAWTSGTNPITSRGSTPAQQNGQIAQVKSNMSKVAAAKEGAFSDKHSLDRVRFILGGAIGLSVIVTTKAGDEYEGIFAGSVLVSSSSRITLKMTKRLTAGASLQSNGTSVEEAALVGTSPEHAMTFDVRDMADLCIPQYTLPEPSRQTNGTSTAFRTDTDISAAAGRGNERVLQKWNPEDANTTDFSLESGGIGHWDQFAAHKEKFGDNSTYDENLYTTTINRNAPNYKQRAAEASRMAQEILAQSSNNAHIREERGLAVEDEYDDEEDKYSGVRRDNKGFPPLPVGGANTYTPPARRAPTAQATVPGVPVDSAIISAQLSKPDADRQSVPKPPTPTKESGTTVTTQKSSVTAEEPAPETQSLASSGIADEHKPPAIDTAAAARRNPTDDNPSDGVEKKVLGEFRQFANLERQRVADRKRAQATQDRTAKLNDLLRFSKTFKLKTPIPTDLVGILAKDPAKQEAIVERAQKEHEESRTTKTPAAAAAATATTSTTSAAGTAASHSAKQPSVAKFDASQVPGPIPDRATFNKGRGGYPQHSLRENRGQPNSNSFLGRGSASYAQRGTGPHQDRKGQTSIPMSLDIKGPPSGPMADQQSPQRSALLTPTSAAASKFNVRAMEFRPNANAPSFHPTAASIPPSSPSSAQRAESVSRATTPATFFTTKKPKSSSGKVSITSRFNSIKRLREDVEKAKIAKKGDELVKDYAFNGGIPNAYHTAPTWQVKAENLEKRYESVFQRPGVGISPSQSRSSSTHHAPYAGQIPQGPANMPQASTPSHGSQGGHHPYGHQYNDGHLQLHPNQQVYPSPAMGPRQLSNYSSPMAPQAQLAYGQGQFYGGPGQVSMPMRPFPGTPGMVPAQPGQMTAPMMHHQQSNGPYMGVMPQYGQMAMYSPNAGLVYPQQNGYPSPGRMAPMMMHSSSQQSHHGGQQMMFPNQAGHMMYGQQQGPMVMMRGGYGHQGSYGSSPHQAPHMGQRAMSSGYGKGMTPNMSQGQGPPANAPQQPAAFGQNELSNEEAK